MPRPRAATETAPFSSTARRHSRSCLRRGRSRGRRRRTAEMPWRRLLPQARPTSRSGRRPCPGRRADIEDAKPQNRAAAANRLHTWVNLSTVARRTPGSASDALLDAGRDRARKRRRRARRSRCGKAPTSPSGAAFAPNTLQFAYCRATGRGTTSWCGGEPVLDADHAWVTIQAPRGTASQLAPYTPVTDIHGVDVYPVTLAASAPNLHDVGTWTSTVGSVTPSHAVWTTLQVCASGSL